ncbi:serine/arginine repetitive matrix protein 4 isoform X1 [Protopterus annectens]|uniref:serine/arginine repetitive matrix protein 4 isoform X1 n=1 Tax=Protopterus annectens TaxID=7888 RepID=UPI001CFBA109|nr:serine/arginine repetitive matrix protein 4 isoform X1 [Protopterus annectens]
MTSIQQGEKQLFEKFWQGTFKAVATPRPESIIVASITARKPLSSAITSSYLTYKAEAKNSVVQSAADPVKETSSVNGYISTKDTRQVNQHRSWSPPCDRDRTPLRPPSSKAKKKKKKSERKKRRRRSPSYSPTPIKKKKKKHSKRRKRNWSTSKKRRRSSSSPKNKRKVQRKHRKRRSSSRSHRSHRRNRHHSHSSTCRSSSCNSRHREWSQETRKRSASSSSSHYKVKKKSKTPSRTSPITASIITFPKCPSPLSINLVGKISQSGPTANIITKKENEFDTLTSQTRNQQEYDSGNDTSSPPATQTSSSGSKVNEEKQTLLPADFEKRLFPKEEKHTDTDNGFDSGNSVISYSSRYKEVASEIVSPGSQQHKDTVRKSPPLCTDYSEEKKSLLPSPTQRSSPTNHSRTSSCSRSSRLSRSSSRSSRSSSLSHRSSSRRSRSRSHSSGKRSYSRSPSYSSKSHRRSPGSRSSQSRHSSSYSRYSPDRENSRDHKKYGSTEKDSPKDRKRDRDRRRRRSYSPLKKRRWDSPSHLEARRITSARKRPVPYYRPSPSTPSSNSSYSSRSSSRSRSRSHSRSRSRSYSSYWSRSRSSRSRSQSWSRSSRSRSKSHNSVDSYDSLRH